MPGVPSSRGCDACRKQKKKCDLSTNPCARCSRLKIPCIGSNQQRYVFKIKTLQKDSSSDSSSGSSTPSAAVTKIKRESPQLLTNEYTLLVSRMIDGITSTSDIKFQLVWNFGDYLNEIPQRLGQNEALDAAADLLLATYTHYRTGFLEPNREVLVKHTNALQALRRSLNDTSVACSSNTLCAIMLLLAQQGLTQSECSHATPVGSHTKGAAQILKQRGHRSPQDNFEAKLVATLKGAVIVEALISDNIIFTPDEWQDLVEEGFGNDTLDGQVVKYLGRLPYLLHRGRDKTIDMKSFLELVGEIGAAFQFFEAIVAQLRLRFTDDLTSVASEYAHLSTARSIVYPFFLRQYCMSLIVGIILGCMLKSVDDPDGHIQGKTAKMADDILTMSPLVSQYRPLGGMYMRVCLWMAWVGTEDSYTRERLQEWIVEYQNDFSPTLTTVPLKYFDIVAERFILKRPNASSALYLASHIEDVDLKEP